MPRFPRPDDPVDEHHFYGGTQSEASDDTDALRAVFGQHGHMQQQNQGFRGPPTFAPPSPIQMTDSPPLLDDMDLFSNENLPNHVRLSDPSSDSAHQPVQRVSQTSAKVNPSTSLPPVKPSGIQDQDSSEEGFNGKANAVEGIESLDDILLFASQGDSGLGADIHGSNSGAHLIRALVRKIKYLERENRWLEGITPTPDEDVPPPSRTKEDERSDAHKAQPIITLYAIQCDESVRYYHDLPRLQRRNGRIHARGGKVSDHYPWEIDSLSTDSQTTVVYLRICPHQRQRFHDVDEAEWADRSSFISKAELFVFIKCPKIRSVLSKGALFPMRQNQIQLLRSVDTRIPFKRGIMAPNACRSISTPPWDPFYFHHRRQFLELAGNHQQPSDGENRESVNPAEAINAIVTIMENHWGTECNRIGGLFANGLVNQESIRWLFHPNMPVVSYYRHEPVLSILSEFSGFEGTGQLLRGWRWSLRDNKLERYCHDVEFKSRVLGETKISLLDVYPLEFAPEHLRSELERRGRLFWRLASPCPGLWSYSGSDAYRRLTNPESRVMIDSETFQRLFPESSGKFQEHYGPDDGLPTSIGMNGSQPENQLVLQLMPPFIHGFDLQTKKWVKLCVKNISEVKFNKTAYEYLLLPPQTKELVRALVETQQRPGFSTDMIEGKGNGLVLLLHGGPGTGKTLTAESVAEIAQRPLYRVTCGDIGTDPESVEKYLNTVMTLGKIWKCVILFDEADVFLEEREISDIARNSIVSVFLRTLEYYDGIMILTSNRVGTFDEAFKSRIQVAIHYAELSRPSRKAIWINFLEILEQSDPDAAEFAELRDYATEIAATELNGREIRNALSTARRLAIYRKQRLTVDHVRQVVDIASRFTKYLDQTHQIPDDERQKERGTRAF